MLCTRTLSFLEMSLFAKILRCWCSGPVVSLAFKRKRNTLFVTDLQSKVFNLEVVGEVYSTQKLLDEWRFGCTDLVTTWVPNRCTKNCVRDLLELNRFNCKPPPKTNMALENPP